MCLFVGQPDHKLPVQTTETMSDIMKVVVSHNFYRGGLGFAVFPLSGDQIFLDQARDQLNDLMIHIIG